MHAAFLPAAWPVPKSVHGFTTLRHGAGVSQAPFDSFNQGLRSGDDETAVERNRRQLAEYAELPSAPHWLRQVHGVEVTRVDEAATPAEPEADAAVTSTPGVVLAILTADCLPVLLAARDGSEIGAAHAGWRGLAAGVLEATLNKMHTPPDRLVAWLGPAAGPRRYEVGVEVYDAFVAKDWGAARAFTVTRPDTGMSISTHSPGAASKRPGCVPTTSTAARCARSPIRNRSIRIVATSAPVAWRRWS